MKMFLEACITKPNKFDHRIDLALYHMTSNIETLNGRLAAAQIAEVSKLIEGQTKVFIYLDTVFIEPDCHKELELEKMPI